jgi:hypothetical protein
MLRFGSWLALAALAIVISSCGGGGTFSPSAPSAAASNGIVPPAVIQDAAVATATSVPTYKFVDLGGGPNGGAALAQGANKTYQGGNYVYSRGSCGKDCSFNIYHAVVWSGSGSSPRDITPSINYFPEAWVYGGGGSDLVGYGVTNNGGYYGYAHALLWRGPSFAWTDINPAGDQDSYAYGIYGNEIVGSGGTSAIHALLWSLANLQTPVDLNPGAFSSSEALAIYGTKQVGYGVTGTPTSTQHAILWNGTSASAVDLTPPGVTSAYAYGLDGVVEVGCGIVAPATASHALLWKGAASTMRDLNPAGFADSCARAAHAGLEAGYGHASNGQLHAIAWSGTAKSAVDLHLSLPSTYTESEAFAFDALGDIIGSVYGSAGWHGAMWIPQ